MGDEARILVNSSASKVISRKVRFAVTPFEKMRGLMFRRAPDYALVFNSSFPGRARLAIHMFFVFYSIDVVYLRKGRVVDFRQGVRPFTPFVLPAKESDTLLELPAGSIEKGAIRLGSVIELRPA